MNVRWLWFDHIPPELGLTREARRRVNADARERRVRYEWAEMVFMVLPFCAVYLVWDLWIAEASFGAPPSGWTFVVQIAVFLAAAYVTEALVLWRLRIRLMREALRHEGYELCMTCGYWLRGLRDDAKQCPECGAEREPMSEVKP